MRSPKRRADCETINAVASCSFDIYLRRRIERRQADGVSSSWRVLRGAVPYASGLKYAETRRKACIRHLRVKWQ